jgi:hypothetical protein
LKGSFAFAPAALASKRIEFSSTKSGEMALKRHFSGHFSRRWPFYFVIGEVCAELG